MKSFIAWVGGKSRLAGLIVGRVPPHDCYCDPPYRGFEDYYGKGLFGPEDFTRLRDSLVGIKGKFLLSINDVPEIRELFKGFRIEEAQVGYSLCAEGKQKRVKELLIMNYTP